MTQALELENWDRPALLPTELVPIRAISTGDFRRKFLDIDIRKGWFMTEAQRETWLQKITEDWDRYHYILSYDGTIRHRRQLQDMAALGGGWIVIDDQYGTGKSVIANIHLKLWQLLKYEETKRLITPYVWWRKTDARREIPKSPFNSAHNIDEGGQKSTGSGSQNIEIHLGNAGQTIRKTGRLVVQPGLDVPVGLLGKAIAIKILPMGIHRVYQANRFIVENYLGRPMWLAALQRCYFPHEQVNYPDGIGTWAEYYARARLYSERSDGIIAGRDPVQEQVYEQRLISLWQEKFKGVKASLDALKFQARQIGIPPENEAMVQEIAAMAAVELRVATEDDDHTNERLEVTEEGWLGLRHALARLTDEQFALYHIPEHRKMSLAEVVRASDGKVAIEPDSLGKQFRQRRRLLNPKAIGDLGERAVASWLDSLWGGGGPGTADVTMTVDTTTSVAINVKTTLEDSFKEHLTVTPECDTPPCAVVLLLPRLLELRVYPITGREMTVNSRTGGRLATPASLRHVVVEVLGL